MLTVVSKQASKPSRNTIEYSSAFSELKAQRLAGASDLFKKGLKLHFFLASSFKKMRSNEVYSRWLIDRLKRLRYRSAHWKIFTIKFAFSNSYNIQITQSITVTLVVSLHIHEFWSLLQLKAVWSKISFDFLESNSQLFLGCWTLTWFRCMRTKGLPGAAGQWKATVSFCMFLQVWSQTAWSSSVRHSQTAW